jgi:hypothetical protein|tara:strand:+ start:253 stop:615 length:363 start_codon:yes stop_codon:yes gene_type:complete
MSETLLIFFLLAIKHGICDLALQALYCRPSHKHIYLAPKAMLHSLHHGVGTWVVLMMFTNYLTAISLAILDLLLHHHIDFVKSSIVKKNDWTLAGKWYWVATTVDQNLHFSGYLLIISLL